jgi:hypothetical protein
MNGRKHKQGESGTPSAAYIGTGMDPSGSAYCTVSKERWLQDFLDTVDFGSLFRKMEETGEYRKQNPDWQRPVVLYGIRKKHKWIKKDEIAVVIDLMPWQQRARMAETHWYKVLYKRPATDLEWEEMKKENPIKRYRIWPYFIEKGWTVDRIISHIVQDDSERYGLDTAKLIKAFEGYYGRKIRIYKRESAVQSKIFR